MPPTMSSTNCDYSCDAVHSCFFLGGEEEDFYPPPQSQLLPGPSEDIWKKFELMHTVSSIYRTRSSPAISPTSTNHLEMVPDVFEEECNPSAAFLQSYIIQDCMWSSSTTAVTTKLEKMVSERLAALRARRDSNADDNTDQTEDQPVSTSRMGTSYQQDLNTEVMDCINPAAVYPYATLSRKQNNKSAIEVGSDLCVDFPQLSSSSDSETEEEDAEIDVMTVDRNETSRSVLTPLLLKQSQINMYQHNYAAQQPSTSTQRPDVKQLNANRALPTQRLGGRCRSPRSDTDDKGKRKSHNVLERQRRSELKMSIMSLRDEVPSVSNNNRASKVMILKKATEFIREVKQDERRLLVKKAELKRRNRDLERRLEQLRTLH